MLQIRPDRMSSWFSSGEIGDLPIRALPWQTADNRVWFSDHAFSPRRALVARSFYTWPYLSHSAHSFVMAARSKQPILRSLLLGLTLFTFASSSFAMQIFAKTLAGNAITLEGVDKSYLVRR